MEIEHIKLKENYKVGLGVIEGLKTPNIFAAGEDNVEPLIHWVCEVHTPLYDKVFV